MVAAGESGRGKSVSVKSQEYKEGTALYLYAEWRGGKRAANHATRWGRHARNGTAAKPGGRDSVSAITI